MTELKFKRLIESVPGAPNSGFLYNMNHRRDAYFPNGQRRTLETGIELYVPVGVVVHITGLYPHRAEGLELIEQRLVGPWQGVVVLDMWNRNSATLQLAQGDAVASIHAYEAPRPLLFAEQLDDVSLQMDEDDSEATQYGGEEHAAENTSAPEEESSAA